MITIKRADVSLDLTVQEAMTLAASLITAAQRALEYKTASASPLVGAATVNDETRGYPGIVSFQVTKEST
jgi:hypothetical protein